VWSDLKFRLSGVTACALALLLTFTSCAPRRIIKPPPRAKSPEEVIALLAGQEADIGTYAGDLDVEFHSEKLQLSFDMELYYRQPSEVAFIFEMILGIDVARGVLHQDTVRVFSPFRNSYFEQELKDKRFLELGDRRFDLLGTVEFSIGKFGFDRDHPKFAGREEGFYLYTLSDTTWGKEFWVNPATLTVAKCHCRHKEESYDLWISYYDFHRMDDRWRPEIITLVCPAKGFRIRIKLHQEKINVEIPDSFFELRIPEDAERIKQPWEHPASLR
jgi:outer membrane lipoprotein-sorting protein